MKTEEEKNNEADINERAITFEVDSKVIEGVRNGDIRQLVLDSKEDESKNGDGSGFL